MGFSIDKFPGVPGGVTGRTGTRSLAERRQAQGYFERAVSPADEQPDAPLDEPAPWESMKTHAALDAYVKEAGVQIPDVWSSLTIAQKKDWLAG